MKPKTKLSLIMPAHNEEKRIRRTLEEYIRFFSHIKKNRELDFEIVVVLNACKDKTRIVVESVKKEFNCNELKIIEFVRGGKGFAIIEGFKFALKKPRKYLNWVC